MTFLSIKSSRERSHGIHFYMPREERCRNCLVSSKPEKRKRTGITEEVVRETSNLMVFFQNARHYQEVEALLGIGEYE